MLFARLESPNHMGLFPRSGFCARESGNHVFTIWKGKRVPFKRSLAGNVVSVVRIKKSQSNSSHCSTARIIQISISLHLPLLMCRMKLSSFSLERVSFHPRKTLINSRYVLTIGRHLVLAGNAAQLVAPSQLYCPHTVRKLRIGRERRGGSQKDLHKRCLTRLAYSFPFDQVSLLNVFQLAIYYIDTTDSTRHKQRNLLFTHHYIYRCVLLLPKAHRQDRTRSPHWGS